MPAMSDATSSVSFDSARSNCSLCFSVARVMAHAVGVQWFVQSQRPPTPASSTCPPRRVRKSDTHCGLGAAILSRVQCAVHQPLWPLRHKAQKADGNELFEWRCRITKTLAADRPDSVHGGDDGLPVDGPAVEPDVLPKRVQVWRGREDCNRRAARTNHRLDGRAHRAPAMGARDMHHLKVL
eukprot:5579631-Prymnesium_polylepis.1